MRAIAIAAACVLSANAWADTITGRASVIDGDTIEIHGEALVDLKYNRVARDHAVAKASDLINDANAKLYQFVRGVAESSAK